MASVAPGHADKAPHRRRRINEIKNSLRAMRSQLALLHHQVSASVELKDVDLDCLELIARHGPYSPSVLARRTGLHPATMTGILDRLQRGGWIVRDRAPDASDRRTVTVRALRERNAELYRLYATMSSALDQICARYDDPELDVLADFLRRATEAGQEATDELAGI